jgi:hypothetical protein
MYLRYNYYNRMWQRCHTFWVNIMTKQWHGGKGDTPRVGNDEAYRSNWDRIFGGIDYGMLDKVDKDKEKDEDKDEGGKAG